LIIFFKGSAVQFRFPTLYLCKIKIMQQKILKINNNNKKLKLSLYRIDKEKVFSKITKS
jgi:hypothetical protein